MAKYIKIKKLDYYELVSIMRKEKHFKDMPFKIGKTVFLLYSWESFLGDQMREYKFVFKAINKMGITVIVERPNSPSCF